jgi:hypothetical protein
MTHGYGYDGGVFVEESEVKSMDMMGNHMKEMDMDTMEEQCIWQITIWWRIRRQTWSRLKECTEAW